MIIAGTLGADNIQPLREPPIIAGPPAAVHGEMQTGFNGITSSFVGS